MAVLIAEEKVRHIRHEVEPLLRMHWLEVGRDRDVMILDPDWPTILAEERAGGFRAFTARANGQLVGYAAFVVRRHLHYPVVCAYSDVVFLAPGTRMGWTAFRLLSRADDALRDSGVFKVYQREKVSAPFAPILRRLGYVHAENGFERRLG